ncbi:MAG TPA: response regulator transcription factor [Gemmatimonadales bacterium]|nr:response regulator transcription factor [Gemmatimonadales bacterium]
MLIHLVLVDDHPIVLAGLEQLLALEGDFAVLAKCSNGEEALQAVRAHRPDILLLDLQMPGKDGLAVLREMRGQGLPTRAVILTASLAQHDVLEAVRLGARGVLLKDMAPDLVARCVRRVHAGGEWLEPHAVSRALDALRRREAGLQEVARVLTPREIDIVRMVARGLRNKEIARNLDITEGTVKIHLHNIYQKANVGSRVALTLYAQEKNLV